MITIYKGKARLGRLVGLKTASCVALTDVNAEDKNALAKIVESVNTNYSERADMIRKTWGGQIMSKRTDARVAKHFSTDMDGANRTAQEWTRRYAMPKK